MGSGGLFTLRLLQQDVEYDMRTCGMHLVFHHQSNGNPLIDFTLHNGEGLSIFG